MHLVGVGHTAGDGLEVGRGIGQTRGGGGDLGGVGVGQGASKADVQANEAVVGLAGVVAHRDVVGPDVGQGNKRCLHPLGQGSSVCAVGNGAGGLAVVGQGEAAAGGLGLGVDLQGRHILSGQVATKADEVVAFGVAGDFHAAGAAKGRVEGVAHGGRTGTIGNARGGIGLAVVGKTQGKAT